LTREIFIERAEKIHSGKYDYARVNYKNTMTKVEIICPIHGFFWQKPNAHLQGRGCAECAKRGRFQDDKPALLYYLRDKMTGLYKIGITNHLKIKRRFSGQWWERIELIFVRYYENGYEAYQIEQKILEENSDIRVWNDEWAQPHSSNGASEFFSENIIECIKQK
jgi:hypothetical protein